MAEYPNCLTLSDSLQLWSLYLSLPFSCW